MNSEEQVAAFEKLSRLKVGALFMEMGTGKTKVALDLIASKARSVGFILWICPFSLKSEIELERQKWHPELDIEIVGFESIGQSDRVYLDLLDRLKSSKAFIVADESLKIKNVGAKRTKRILEFSKYAEYKLILNGTPISKNCLDLWSQMEFLSPKILKMCYRFYKDTFCEYYVRGRLKGVIKHQHNIPYLISLIQPYIFDAELDLAKKKHFLNYHYKMDADQAQEYEKIKEDILFSVPDDYMTDLQIFKLFSLLQSCYTTSPDKQQIINEITADSDEQFIVFVKYLHSINGDCIQGSTPEADRAVILDRFRRGEIRVLYLTYGVGSYGLNLQNCHNMISQTRPSTTLRRRRRKHVSSA